MQFLDHFCRWTLGVRPIKSCTSGSFLQFLCPHQSWQGQGNTSQPYAVYQSMSRQRQRLTSGVVAATAERVQVTVVGETRSSAQASANWIASKITSTPSRQTVGSLFIHHWRIEDEVSANEVYQDGSDESARIISVEIVGTYTE